MATLKLIDNIVSSIDSNLNQTSIDSTSKKDNIPLSKHFIQSEKTTVLDKSTQSKYVDPGAKACKIWIKSLYKTVKWFFVIIIII